MRSPVITRIRKEKEALTQSLVDAIRSSEAAHYRDADSELVRQRCQTLVDEFLAAFSKNPKSFATYLRRIATERMAEGYFLDELQLVLDLFRQRIWQLTAEALDDRQLLVEYLDLATSIVTEAKDAAARTYLERAQKEASAPPRRDVNRLFAGTEPPPQIED
jgi:hypothetical protein